MFSTLMLSLLFFTLAIATNELGSLLKAKIPPALPAGVRTLMTFEGAHKLIVRVESAGGKFKEYTIYVPSDALISDIYEKTDPPLIPCKWNLMFRGKMLSMKASVAESLTVGAKIEFYPTSTAEQFLSTFSNTNFKEILLAQGRDLRDSCSWLPWIRCSDQGIPVMLDMFSDELQGNQIRYECLPHSLNNIQISRTKILSSIDFRKLPSDLERLQLSHNLFFGRLDFSHLPRSLKNLDLSNNEFAGIINFSDMPPNLEIILLAGNSFNGDLILSEPLPPSLEYINVANNRFSGEVDLHGLKDTKVRLVIDFAKTQDGFNAVFKEAMSTANLKRENVIFVYFA